VAFKVNTYIVTEKNVQFMSSKRVFDLALHIYICKHLFLNNSQV